MPVRQISIRDGLPNHQARVVRVLRDRSIWIGFEDWASRQPADSEAWRTYGPEAGLEGAVMDIADGPDGTVWLLRVNSSFSDHWWLSALRPDGSWLHVDMRQLTGLQPPRTRDAIAIDGWGRPWFIAYSTLDRSAFVGILDVDATRVESLNALGVFPKLAADRLFLGQRADAHGLLSDGSGGVVLYNEDRDPVRHWRP